MFKTLFVTALLSFSVGAKSLDHREAATSNQATYVNGSYNFVDEFDFDNDDYDFGSLTITFEDISNGASWLNPISYNSGDAFWYYLYSVTFNFTYYDETQITFNCYDYFNDVSSFVVTIVWGNNVSDIDSRYNDLIINFRNTYILSGDEAKIFNTYFTQEDNILTTTYNGYYSFNNNLSSIGQLFFVSGAISFNNQIYNFFTNKGNVPVSSSYTYVQGSYYDISTGNYYDESFGLPFNRNYVSSNNILMSNAKMTKVSYNVLSNVGVFAYVRDTSYDDSDWKDLLFSVMDSPIYMISRLLNFEIFGINLYIALAGLLTIVVIVFCVRKFM